MTKKVKVKLLKPLDGAEIGDVAEYYETDVKRLVMRGAVRRLKQTKTRAQKAAPKPNNKAAPNPENKSAS